MVPATPKKNAGAGVETRKCREEKRGAEAQRHRDAKKKKKNLDRLITKLN